MTWFKMDDQFPNHPKVRRAGDAAGWLFVCSGCYCAQYLTDGMVPKVVVGSLTGMKPAHVARAIERLIDVELWLEHEDYYEVNNYLEFNPSREKVENDRREAAERRARGTERSRDVRATKPRDHGAPVPVPVPNVPTERESAQKRARSRGSRIPDQFHVTPEMEAWVEGKYPQLAWLSESEKFVDHYKAKAGSRALMVDWDRAWKVWMRRAAEGFRG
jgi:hypothetical protein